MSKTGASGLLVIDKPQGITSRAAVNRAQGWFPRGTRLGHAGTLDPLATGVLVLCVGTATRLVEYVQRMDKEYLTDLVLGAASDTDDAEGVIRAVPDVCPPSLETLQRELPSFVGVIEQIPPAFSAAKVAGERAHALARQGQEINLTPRPVRIDHIELLHFAYPHVRLQIRCGKGTYIRSIARDLGRRLGCGAYVRTLRRLRIGPFTPEMATPLDRPAAESVALLPLEMAVSDLPAIVIDSEMLGRLAQGQRLYLDQPISSGSTSDGEVTVFCEGQLRAVARWDDQSKSLSPVKVLK